MVPCLDLIAAPGVIEQIADDVLTFQRMAERLAPGGKILAMALAHQWM